MTASLVVMAVPVVPETSTFAIVAEGVGATTVNLALLLVVTAKLAPLAKEASGIVIDSAALTALVGVPANSRVTVVSPEATALLAVIVIPLGSPVTQDDRSAPAAMTSKVSLVKVMTASLVVMAVPVVPETSTFAIVAEGVDALAVDRPLTPIASVSAPVISARANLLEPKIWMVVPTCECICFSSQLK
jgi:hypothetical protein